MSILFKIGNIEFKKEDFDYIFMAGESYKDLDEFEDIIETIKDFEDEFKGEEIQCAEINDCCKQTKINYIAEVYGAVTEEGEFFTLNEMRMEQGKFEKEMLYPYGIQVYKCLNCNKWMINILES